MKYRISACIVLSLACGPLWAQRDDGPAAEPDGEEKAGEERAGPGNGKGEGGEDRTGTAAEKRRPRFTPSEKIEADSVLALPADI